MNKVILNIGPRHYKDNSSTGGIVVLFENWVEFCENSSIRQLIIDTNKGNYLNTLWAYISILCQFFYKIFKSDVIFFNGTANDYLYIAPIVVFVGKLFGKKVVLRKFAGNFDVIYSKYSSVKKRVINYVLTHSDINFWETKHLVDFGRSFNKNTYWFPNVRNRLEKPIEKFNYKRRFVFISQVKKEKGIDVLLTAFRQLDNTYQLDLYGPLMGYQEKQLFGNNYRYCGVLQSENVVISLKKNDVLLLPTFWDGEGYPGIILEALSIGIPIVSTYQGGIPEIVTDGYNGFLVEPKNVEQLISAIKKLDNADYQTLSRNALSSFENFDADIVNKRVWSIITI